MKHGQVKKNRYRLARSNSWFSSQMASSLARSSW